MNLQIRYTEFLRALRILDLTLPSNFNFGEFISPYLDRPYHNLNHIGRCLYEIGELFKYTSLTSEQWAQLVIAAWFHDIVYDPQRIDNEIQSAFYFVTRINNYPTKKSPVHAAEIVDLILATRSKKDDSIYKFSYLCQKMREIDLCGLLDPIESVLTTDSLVREEFKHIDESTWKINRCEFLKNLVSTEPFIQPSKNTRLKNNVEELIRRRYS